MTILVSPLPCTFVTKYEGKKGRDWRETKGEMERRRGK